MPDSGKQSGSSDRWDDRLMPPLRTNLIDTYLELKAFINKHLPEKFYMEGDQRVDLRDKIFREVVANCIVHREYTSAICHCILMAHCLALRRRRFSSPDCR